MTETRSWLMVTVGSAVSEEFPDTFDGSGRATRHAKGLREAGHEGVKKFRVVATEIGATP